MSRLVWVFGWVGVAIWSLVSFAVYGAVNLVGRAAMRHADMFSDDPDTVEGVWRLFSWLHGLSTSVTLVVWGLVTLAILSVPWLFDRLAAAAAGSTVPPPPPYRAPDGVIDLPPADYVVHPRGAGDAGAGGRTGAGGRPGAGGQPGPVPQIGPWRS